MADHKSSADVLLEVQRQVDQFYSQLSSPPAHGTMADHKYSPDSILELKRQVDQLVGANQASLGPQLAAAAGVRPLSSSEQAGYAGLPPMKALGLAYAAARSQARAQDQDQAEKVRVHRQRQETARAIAQNAAGSGYPIDNEWESESLMNRQALAQAMSAQAIANGGDPAAYYGPVWTQRALHERARAYERAIAHPSAVSGGNASGGSLYDGLLALDITALGGGDDQRKTEPDSPEKYSKPFCDFLTENPTIFHAVKYFEGKLGKAGYEKISERESWTSKIKAGGKYYLTRNGSGLIAFSVGTDYKSGDGVAMIAGHIDALTAKLKPISKKDNKAGYVQLGVAQYGGALNETWWDRDLGVGGRILVKRENGKVESLVVKIDHPIAKIPTLAPHFGVGILGTNNPETQAVPIIGIDNSDLGGVSTTTFPDPLLSGSFAATQPPALLKAIAEAAGVSASSIVNWELELFDTQPAQLIGLNKDILSGGRIDDKLCSWAAIEALLVAPEPSQHIDLVALFDDEEIGSLLRQGARGNFLPSTIERIAEVFQGEASARDALQRTYANSFLVSADVSHAVNPNFLDKYLPHHAPRLNVGVVVSGDSNGHMTTDAVSTAFMQRVAQLAGSELQVFQIRNDSRSGGTVGPMLSSAMGCRAIDVGIPQLSMHSVRASTGSLDPGLGVRLFHGVFKFFEKVGGEFDF